MTYRTVLHKSIKFIFKVIQVSGHHHVMWQWIAQTYYALCDEVPPLAFPKFPINEFYWMTHRSSTVREKKTFFLSTLSVPYILSISIISPLNWLFLKLKRPEWCVAFPSWSFWLPSFDTELLLLHTSSPDHFLMSDLTECARSHHCHIINYSRTAQLVIHQV